MKTPRFACLEQILVVFVLLLAGAVNAQQNNANLRSLTLSAGILTPTFAPNETDYSTSVPYAAMSLTLTAETEHGAASIAVQVNGGGFANAPSGSPSGPLVINVGTNLVEVRVTSGNFSIIKIYRVLVTRSAVSPPDVLTLAAVVSAGTATLNGVANPQGTNTSAWFEWGTNSNYGNTTPALTIGAGTSNTNFSQSLAGLNRGVSYHFRAGASNSHGTTFGTDLLFTFAPNVLYTWAGSGNLHEWSRSFGAANTSATLSSSTPGEMTVSETSAVAGGSQAFSDGFNRIRESSTAATGGLDLTEWDYVEFVMGHNGAGNINVQFFVQVTPSSTFVALGPDIVVAPGVNTYRVPLSGLTAAQAVYIRTIGFNTRDHAALGNVVWTLREVRATDWRRMTRDLITHDTGTPEGGLQGAIVGFDNSAVLGSNGGTNQTGLSWNSAGTGSLQWTDLGGQNGAAISWGNGTAWNGNTFNNRATDLSSFGTMLVRISAAGAGGAVNVQGFFQVNGFTFQDAGNKTLPIDGQFHDLAFSLIGLTDMNVVAQFGINLSTHASDLVMNIDQIRFGLAEMLRPGFSGTTLSGTNLVVSGTNGAANANYAVLTTTNATLPLSNWVSLVTNQFDSAGNFSFTNAITPQERQRYFRLRTP